MSHQYIFFLGTHSELSRVEIEAVLQRGGFSPRIQEQTADYLLLETAQGLEAQLQDVLGGTDRFGAVEVTLPHLPAAQDLMTLLPSPAGARRVAVGLSGLGVDRGALSRITSDLKESWQAAGGKMRFVLPTGRRDRLAAAAVMSHRLDEAPNAEFTIIRLEDRSFVVVRTIAVQDIRSYELRDTQRPSRDAHVGLLPPKLAQVMLNVAVGSLAPSTSPLAILDPFCGMGTLLQEGWLMDHTMVGSDSSERMIRASEKNLQWLAQHFTVTTSLAPRTFVHDADTRWSKRWEGAFDAVVTEPFLGKPMKSILPPKELTRRMDALGELYQHFFKVTWPILKKDGVILFALPAWRKAWREEDWNLFPEAFLDGLSRLGYSKIQLGDDPRGTLLYARPDALVGRELTLWRKT